MKMLLEQCICVILVNIFMYSVLIGIGIVFNIMQGK